VYRWFKSEYFYSWIDRPYFQSKEFSKLLDAMGLGLNPKMTCLEWSIVR